MFAYPSSNKRLVLAYLNNGRLTCEGAISSVDVGVLLVDRLVCAEHWLRGGSRLAGSWESDGYKNIRVFQSHVFWRCGYTYL